MSDELNLLRYINRGEEAKRLLDNDLLREGIELIRSNILLAIEEASVHDSNGVMEAKRMLHTTKEFERHLKSVLETGKMAKAELDEMQKRDAMLSKIHRYHGKA